jgi:REP-associated tyrosine transposase
MREHIGREHPAEGVFVFRGQPTIAFLTVCARGRAPLLANLKVNNVLVASWRKADSWLVGYYLIMPDHLHLFCAPNRDEVTIEKWIAFWKGAFRRLYGADPPRFQSRGFHHRLRRNENYHDKWDYVRANPVRAGLVSHPDDWPYFGVLNELRW